MYKTTLYIYIYKLQAMSAISLTLLSHELLEMGLIESGMEQRTAHNYAENQFNYGKESNEYYDRLKKHN